VLTKALQTFIIFLGLSKGAADPECRSRLRQISAFFCQTQSRSQKFLKSQSRIWSHFSLFAVEVFWVGFINVISQEKTLLNFDCIGGSRSLNRSQILKFERFVGSGFTNFGVGAQSESENVTPVISEIYHAQWRVVRM